MCAYSSSNYQNPPCFFVITFLSLYFYCLHLLFLVLTKFCYFQPFPLQTSSLFGGPLPSSTPGTLGTIGIGSAPRNVNIHIHAGKQKLIVFQPMKYSTFINFSSYQVPLFPLFQQLVLDQIMGKGPEVNSIMSLVLVVQVQHGNYLLEML